VKIIVVKNSTIKNNNLKSLKREITNFNMELMMKNTLVTTIFIILMLTIACSKTKKFGSGVDNTIPQNNIKNILNNENLLNKKYNFVGIVSSQCKSNGCWFILKDKDNNNTIFVDAKPGNFKIPLMIGKTVKVTGKFVKVNNKLQIDAYGLEVIN